MTTWLQAISAAGLLLLLVACGGEQTSERAVDTAPLGQIAFASDRDGDYEIYVMDPDEGRTTQLTHNKGWIDLGPAWSPDGTRIAFQRSRDGDPADIYVMGADGSAEKRLTQTGDDDRSPGWTPDGRVTFVRCHLKGVHLALVGCDVRALELKSSKEDKLYQADNVVHDAEVSPDGKWLAVSTTHDLQWQTKEIHVIDLDSGEDRRVTDNDADDHAAAWSPDGNRLAFISNRVPGTQAGELYVMHANGSSVTRLTKTVEDEDSPVWSADGSQIVYSGFSVLEDETRLYVMNADGTCSRPLTGTGDFDLMPDWLTRHNSKQRRLDC